MVYSQIRKENDQQTLSEESSKYKSVTNRLLYCACHHGLAPAYGTVTTLLPQRIASGVKMEYNHLGKSIEQRVQHLRDHVVHWQKPPINT